MEDSVRLHIQKINIGRIKVKIEANHKSTVITFSLNIDKEVNRN